MSQIFTGALPANPVPLEGAAFNHGPAELAQAQLRARVQPMQIMQGVQMPPAASGQVMAQIQPQAQPQILPQVQQSWTPSPAAQMPAQAMPQTVRAQPQLQTAQSAQPVNPAEAFEQSKAESAETLGAVATNSKTFVPNLQSGFNLLPQTREEAIALAKYLSTSQFVPAEIRSTAVVDRSADVFLMLAMGTARGMSIADCLSNIYVLFGRMSLYVRAKEGLCVKYGRWTVTLDDQNAVATAEGWRYDNGDHKVAQYSGHDARLRGLMDYTPETGWIGLGKGKGGGWSDKWPDMLRVRALGRLLDALFPDVIGGFVSREEMEDEQSYQASAAAKSAASEEAPSEAEAPAPAASKSTSTASRVKAKLKKAAEKEAQPAPVPQPSPVTQAQPQSVPQPVSQAQPAVNAIPVQNPDVMPMPLDGAPGENPF